MSRSLGTRQQSLVDALRSGDFRQGDGFLSSRNIENGELLWCPLGVMAELYQREHATESWWQEDQKSRMFIVRSEWVEGGVHLLGFAYDIPDRVRYWFRFSEEGSGMDKLAELNDHHGLTLDEIATLLESDPEAWFAEEV